MVTVKSFTKHQCDKEEKMFSEGSCATATNATCIAFVTSNYFDVSIAECLYVKYRPVLVGG